MRKPESEDSAITTEYRRNGGFLAKFLTRFLSNRQDIEDVVQEAFLRAYVAEKQQNIEQPKAYLFHIAKNLAFTRLSRKSRQIEHILHEAGCLPEAAHAPSAAAEAEALESLGIYCEAVAALPEKCRQVYLLRKVHGLSHREIAERMALSVSSVEKYLLKGVLHCKAYIDKRDRGADTPSAYPSLQQRTGGKQQ